MSTEKYERKKELWLLQLKQCWADIRQFDSMMWQLPTAIAAIGALSLNVIADPVIYETTPVRVFHLVIAVMSLLITSSLVFALMKNRYFQEWRVKHREILFKALKNLQANGEYDNWDLEKPITLKLEKVPGLIEVDTRSLGHYTRLLKRSAYKILLIISFLIVSLQLILVVWIIRLLLVSPEQAFEVMC